MNEEDDARGILDAPDLAIAIRRYRKASEDREDRSRAARLEGLHRAKAELAARSAEAAERNALTAERQVRRAIATSVVAAIGAVATIVSVLAPW